VFRITLCQPGGGADYVIRKPNVEDVDKFVRKLSCCNVMHVTEAVRYCTVVHACVSPAP
jgi:hypothetical protein